MTKRFAERTSVAVSKSKTDIEKELRAYGADGFGMMEDTGRMVLQFRKEDRVVKILLKLPHPDRFRYKTGFEQEERRIWRSLFLVLKAKLESVGSGIETFDEAFFPHIVVPGSDGLKTIGERFIPRMQEIMNGQDLKLIPEETDVR